MQVCHYVCWVCVVSGMVCGGSGMSGALFHQATSSNISVHNAFYAGKSPQVQPLPMTSQCQQPLTLTETSFVPSNYTSAPATLGQQPLSHHTMTGQWPQPPQQTSTITASPADVSQVSNTHSLVLFTIIVDFIVVEHRYK